MSACDQEETPLDHTQNCRRGQKSWTNSVLHSTCVSHSPQFATYRKFRLGYSEYSQLRKLFGPM